MASDKTQAFAYLKIFGVPPFLPTALFFVGEPWQWLGALYPPYGASKAYWLGEAGSEAWPWWVAVGLLTSTFWIRVSAHFYATAARR